MYNVKTMNKISRAGLDVLAPEKYAVGDNIANPDAILVRSAKMHDCEFNPELMCIARAGAGTNNIPIERCSDNGIVVFNAPGANAEAVKELVLCALLMASRKVVDGIDWVKSIAGTEDVAGQVEKGKSAFTGPELNGKTLGVIGLGAIGAKIANAAINLGMKVYGYDPYLSVEAAWKMSSGVKHATDVETIYRNCDYVTVHVPYMESTHHMIDAKAISMMKDGVRVLNLARGELVDDDAMLEALESGKVAVYVTDFPNDKTAGAKGVIAIPHLGASTPESEDNCARMAAQEIVEYIENGNIINSVNMPRAVMERAPAAAARLCVIHKNIPDMIAKITGSVSGLGINIENMVNGSRGNSAYTMCDLCGKNDSIASAVEAIEGVVRARVIEF